MKQMAALRGVLTDEEQDLICPIRYLHNPLQSSAPYLYQTHLSFPSTYLNFRNLNDPTFSTFSTLEGSIPYCSSIPAAYESKYWRESIEAARTFVHLLATDKDMADIEIRDGLTLRKIAQHELRPGFKHRCMRATAYMYPFCVEPRKLEILAVLMVMQFLFDEDKCEGADEKQVPVLVADFLRRLEDPAVTVNKSRTALQAYLDSIISDIHGGGGETGNGGAEVYLEMRKTFTYLRPRAPITSIGDYLEFRRENVSAGFVFAGIKFSLASNVDIHQPLLERFMTWAADHLAITNDLYSYAKEMRAFRNGTCPDLINIVAILEKLLSLPNQSSALEITYALLLQREQWMFEELKKFEASGCLDEGTWMFLRGVWACLSGNTLYSMTCERYGGEAARIAENRDFVPPVNGPPDMGKRP
ncbi:terpenoid synthase [Lindgomyces ingoldianus]|uniref:Terpenoid synthase n=1 Tax=Lindgomyces ingoldianus TaxID=673940 RepID=A0ACB6R5S5_9PLEO|nr:terpenoid synthase [Lindgomyces ingoldianus]KAF2474422.1 terpenoid synthase [Lindgomyces ingoldianus]